MPTFVRTDKCDGCKGQDKTACMYICPHDLMKLDKDGSETGHAMKAFNQEPEQCWECYSCVKICPQQAMPPPMRRMSTSSSTTSGLPNSPAIFLSSIICN